MAASRDIRGCTSSLPSAARIPYSVHLSDVVLRTSLLDYLQVFRCIGVSFESADDAHLNDWHERLNALWRNIAAPGVALWSHVVRRRERSAWAQAPGHGFAALLHDRYRQRLADHALMVNELYLSVLYRPDAGLGRGLLGRALRRAPLAPLPGDTEAELMACGKLAQTVQASLARYEPQCLGCYEHDGRRCSELAEFLGLLVNGEWQPLPLSRSALAPGLATSRLLFGHELVEYRTPSATRLGAVLAIKEYPTPVPVGIFNRLLSAPFAFVLSQSFAFLSKASSQGLLHRQIHRFANARDYSLSQAQELRRALDALTSNEFVMGEHHLSLQVLVDVETGSERAGAAAIRSLQEAVALARSLLSDTGMTVAREDLALEAAFWAQLPGNFPMRPRVAPITSRNFAAMAPLHNYPAGRARGNHWGDALTVFMSSARSPYYFSLHASDPHDPAGGSRRDTGHTFICGPTGSGKTVFIGFLVAMLERSGATQVIFDKDRGLEILLRALRGEYLPLRHGPPTGFNPLQLPVQPRHIEFLKVWLHMLVRSGAGERLSARQQADLEQALNGTLAMEPAARRLSRLIEFLDPTDAEGVHARLSRWCESTRGDYAWVFDNPEDRLVPRLAQATLIGIDVTEFLEHESIRAPVSLYLFHLVRELLDGRRLVCWMDEFWRLLADPAFEGFAREGPRTWRKLNGVMCLATQSAGDVLGSPISRTIIEQTATKIFFPNPDGDAAEYMGGFGLSEREFCLIRHRLEPGSRSFLVKQGHHSVVCQLDLRGFEAELHVISGRTRQVSRMHELIAQSGAEPQDWLPRFLREQGLLCTDGPDPGMSPPC